MQIEGKRVRPLDLLWGAVAVAAAGGFGWFVARRLWLVIADPRDAGLLGLAISVGLALLFGRWVVLGAWRRTVWGAPPGGLRDHQELRHLDDD